MTATQKIKKSTGRADEDHRSWLSLIDIDGPFLSLPVLRRTFPVLDSLDAAVRDRLRQEHKTWQADAATEPGTWVEFVLGELLGWGPDVHWLTQDEQTAFAVDSAEHDTRINPDFALVEPGHDLKPAGARLLGIVCPPGQHPTARIPGDTWAASPADRLAMACRKHEVPLGLVADGRWWTLLHVPREGATTRATFDAIGWDSAAERILVRAFVSLLGRGRFFSVPDEETLPALIAASEEFGEDLTNKLGVQVRQAVELLVAAIGRADTMAVERGEAGLADIDAGTIYRGAVSVLMRSVFVLYAEERGLLPADNELYAASYALGRLCTELEDSALRYGEDELEHSYAGWHRVLALFDVVYWGINHSRLHMAPHDGSLFDSGHYWWLPRTIDDRALLHLLRSIQYVEVGGAKDGARRRLSYKELDVEKIGYIYEGLLSFDGYRAAETYICLTGKSGSEAEVPLRELEEIAASADDLQGLSAELSQRFKSSGIGSPRALERKLDPQKAGEAEAELLRATRGDIQLARRITPFAGIVRRDLRGQPMVVGAGELFVTDSPLRKNSGTVYTPKELCDEVVLHTLEPLVYAPGPLETADRAQWTLKSAEDILKLKVADIAMGSGAFLVAAARYLGDRLVEAWARTGDAQAMAANIDRVLGTDNEDRVTVRARRKVIENCLYGVDINETAVEVAKVSLWLVSLDRDLPFTFLDDRLRTGDSLLGITSIEQLRWMHVNPERGKELHQDLFQWPASTDALLENLAERRRRIPGIEIDPAGPLASVAEKRKILRENEEDVAELKLLGDLLAGALLENSSHGAGALDKAALQAAYWANKVRREDTADVAREQADKWLQGNCRYTFPRRSLHWALEFYDLFEEGGFDAIFGNNPYLGGQKLTGVLGTDYRNYLVESVGNGVRGSADLIAYFVLRVHALLKDTGQAGIIATNTLHQGDTREVGLDQLLTSGVTIRRSIKSEPWPSRSSSLEYCAIWTSKKEIGPSTYCQADNKIASRITASLDPASRITGAPIRLLRNREISFIGSCTLGLGFTMTPERARELIHRDKKNSEVVFPYLNGQDLNSSPTGASSRWIVNFHNWSQDRAKEYL